MGQVPSGFIDQTRIDDIIKKQPFGLEEALYLLKCGKRVHRAAWTDIKYIELQRPDEQSKMRQAYLFCVPKDGQPVPYSLSNNDLFNTDWKVAG